MNMTLLTIIVPKPSSTENRTRGEKTTNGPEEIMDFTRGLLWDIMLIQLLQMPLPWRYVKVPMYYVILN